MVELLAGRGRLVSLQGDQASLIWWFGLVAWGIDSCG